MKKVLLASVFTLLSAFVAFGQTEKTQSYGEKITVDGAIDVKKLPGMVKEGENLPIKVTGTVQSVCQKKGCWMKMEMADGKTMMVHFKDYGFFVPKDCNGKRLTMEGFAFIEVTPVDQLRHYAEDAGKSKAEIEKIVDPEKELTFEASGVLIYE
ncbi:MAG: hypothetical protein RIQ47_381 [Bacteroidota bacterium]|jgi:hypothetical protein